MGISREGWGLRDGTPPNRKQTGKKHLQTGKKHQQTRKTPFEQGKRLSSKGYLPIKCKSLQMVGVSGQGKAEETKGNGRRRWRGVGPAGRPSPFPFGGSIVNNLLSLGAEPTNVERQDGLIEWKSDGYIDVGGVQVWAYYYFEDGEDVDRCDWEDHMEIEVEECWI